MRVLVTGGHGFIGCHVLEVLAAAGVEAVSYDTAQGQDIKRLPELQWAAKGCTHVIHLAGMLGTAELFDTPHDAVDVNVHGALNVLQVCERYRLGYVGITMPPVWSNVYQATKRCAQQLASAWHMHRGVPVSHVRAFNAYGTGQKLYPVQKIIPTFAHRAWRGLALPIWGDGTQQVDLVWAGDIAEMLVRALGFGDDQVFDAGTGEGLSVTEVAQQVISIAGAGRVEHAPMRPGEHEAKCVAGGQGWDLMGWHPPVRPGRLAEAVHSYRPPD